MCMYEMNLKMNLSPSINRLKGGETNGNIRGKAKLLNYSRCGVG